MLGPAAAAVHSGGPEWGERGGPELHGARLAEMLAEKPQMLFCYGMHTVPRKSCEGIRIWSRRLQLVQTRLSLFFGSENSGPATTASILKLLSHGLSWKSGISCAGFACVAVHHHDQRVTHSGGVRVFSVFASLCATHLAHVAYGLQKCMPSTQAQQCSRLHEHHDTAQLADQQHSSHNFTPPALLHHPDNSASHMHACSHPQVGFGKTAPTHIPNPAASCPDSVTNCNAPIGSSQEFASSAPNPHTLYGALVAGPGSDDSYDDARASAYNRISIEYNGGLSAALAIAHGRDWSVCDERNGFFDQVGAHV